MPRITGISSLNRPSNVREVNKKYFFAVEGIRTEVNYIKGLISKKRTNSHIFYFYRSKSKAESSNILRITENIIDVIDGKSEMSLMYVDLEKIILDVCCKENILIDQNKIHSKIEKYINSKKKNMHDEIEFSVVKDLLVKITKVFEMNIASIINSDSIIDLIKKQSTYCKEVDKIIIVGDRDRKSFVDNQYESVLSLIKNKNIHLIISNPCIEFWFLLHHTDALTIDKSEWASAQNAANLVFTELKKYDHAYKKNNSNFGNYIQNKSIALENVKLYSEKLSDLKEKIGTNMRDLFEIINEM